MKDLIAQVKAAMNADYAKWNMIIECWDDDQLLMEIGAATSVKGALRKLGKHASAYEEARLNTEADLHQIDSKPGAVDDDHPQEDMVVGQEEVPPQEVPQEQPRVTKLASVTIPGGWIKGNYAYTPKCGADQKTRWFALKDLAFCEVRGDNLYIEASTAALKKRGLEGTLMLASA